MDFLLAQLTEVTVFIDNFLADKIKQDHLDKVLECFKSIDGTESQLKAGSASMRNKKLGS